MSHPKKPRLAFAWIGAARVLSPLWSTMMQTLSGGELPQELMPRPQILAVETETWSYRFSRCALLSELLYMRVNARRHSGLLWCKEAGAQPEPEEYKMLCYAGCNRLPVVVFVYGAEEATEAADREELHTRPLLDDLGFHADEALFVYEEREAPITHLYQKLDQALHATEERKLPPLMVRCEEVNLLLFLQGLAPPEEAPEWVTLRERGLLLRAEVRQVLRQHQYGELTALTLRASFAEEVALRPEALLSGALGSQGKGELSVKGCVF